MKKEISILDGAVKLQQIESGFHSGLDAVVLAAACPAAAGDHVLDLGTGIGTAGLALLKRVQDVKLTGIDIQQDHVDVAADNAGLNATGVSNSFPVDEDSSS